MTKTTASAYLAVALLTTTMSNHVMAEDNARLEEVIIIGTYQAASRSHTRGEGNGELYLLGALDMGPGTWHLEVRGSTTPRNGGVTSVYNSNATVGETVNSNGDGRIAATQLYYELPAGPGKFRAGLLDPTALLDAGEVANDEYTQFLSDAFVNNPSIGFPSYVLGAAYKADLTEYLDYHLFVGSDSGLQDDDDPTYHNVFSVGGHRQGHHKGVFTSGEMRWHANGYSLMGGVWYDTGQVDRLGHSHGSANGYGFYALVNTPVGPGLLAGRAAIANKKTQEASNFLSLSYQLPLQLAEHKTTLGVAVGRTGESSRLAFNSDPIYQAEAYWRINVIGPLHVSPDIQYIDNAGFHADRHGTVVGGLRAGIEF